MIEKKVRYKNRSYVVKMTEEMTGSVEAEYMNGFYACLDTEVKEENGKPQFKQSLRTSDFNVYRVKAFDQLIVGIDMPERKGNNGQMYKVSPSLNGDTFEQFKGAEKWTDLIPWKVKVAVMDEVYDQELLETVEIEEETKKKLDNS